MVKFEKHILSNGLKVLVHHDDTTPMAAVNILYDVGARDEDPERTGFAHLFEHFMFEGSVNIPSYDRPLQFAGGENNAFTTNDITNYYLTLPARNLEVAFWLESDRMLGLAFSEEKLQTQKNVVTEEYRQSYLNQPYGDAWLLLQPLAYKVHPYRWSTIGASIDHIQNASLDEVKAFFSRFYHPANAILSVTGNVDPEDVVRLAEKWFGAIRPGEYNKRKLPRELDQQEERRMKVFRDVPQNQVYLAFHMCGRSHADFHAADLISDLLANGESARLNSKLVHEKKYFSEVNAYVTGQLDPGLLIITGKPKPEIGLQEAEDALWSEASLLVNERVGERELQKVKNKVEASHVFTESNLLAKAMNLAYYELMGDADLLNQQVDAWFKVGAADIQRVAGDIFSRKNANVLHYCVEER
jgi:zinc protease